MRKWKIIVPLMALAGIGAWGLLSFWPQEPERQGDVNVKPAPAKVAKKGKGGERKVRLQKSGRVKVGVTTENGKKEKPKIKPSFALDDDDEAKLNEEQRRTIEAIRAALDDNSRKTVLKLVQKLQASDEWPDGIPKSIKMAAIEALGWFGPSCLPELAGFLADGDAEVVQSAIDKYSDMISDVELSDYERADILIAASKIIDDPDAMDSMLLELNNMRNSLKVSTIKVLMREGNSATKQVLPDNIEFAIGEEGIKTPQQLDEWYKENPDDEDDNDFYGNGKPPPAPKTDSKE